MSVYDIAETLKGSWRNEVAPLWCDARGLEGLLTPLIASGCGCLVWRRIHGNNVLADSRAGRILQDLWRLNAMQFAAREKALGTLLRYLADAGVRPILLKGLSAARLYPDHRVRPVGDIDLLVPPGQHELATSALLKMFADGTIVPFDLSHSASELDERSFDDIASRCATISFGTESVMVLGPEDNLRFLCLHFLLHGGGRAIWLCDVAAAVESRPKKFNWEICQGDDPDKAEWISYTVALAHELLDARIDDTPVLDNANKVPHWLRRSIVQCWNTRTTGNMDGPNAPVPSPLKMVAFARAVRQRWPDPVSAAMRVGGRPETLSPFSCQLRWSLRRAAKYYF